MATIRAKSSYIFLVPRRGWVGLFARMTSVFLRIGFSENCRQFSLKGRHRFAIHQVRT